MSGLQLENGWYAAWVFDFDGNIVNNSTFIVLKNMRTWKYEEIPWHEIDQNPHIYSWPNSIYKVHRGSYVNFRDVSFAKNHWWHEQLLRDTILAYEKGNMAASFEVIKEMFWMNWRINSILTARWHCSENFQRVFAFLNSQALTSNQKREQIDAIRDNFCLWFDYSDAEVLSYYFSEVCDYMAVNNPQIEKFFRLHWLKDAEKKTVMMNWYIEEVKRKIRSIMSYNWVSDDAEVFTSKTPIALWFSDDSVWNILAMSKYLKARELNSTTDENLRSRIFYTWPQTNYKTIQQKLQWMGTMQEITQHGNPMLEIRIET